MGRVLIIAEAGVNHNGDVRIAKKLIDAAVLSGADIIKFQTFDVDAITSKHARMAAYQERNIGHKESQKEMLASLALTNMEYIELSEYCKEKGIGFLSTPFDMPSIAFLEKLDMDVWKVPSGEITNYPYLIALARTGRDIILSTGMSQMEEVRAAIALLMQNGAGNITLLHCTTQYPTPYEDVNLRAMITMRNEFGLEVGYSDHTRGIEVSIAAAALGAVVIEKHFTLSRDMKGPDHKASLEPDELNAMVEAIRHIESAMGCSEKRPAESELENVVVARKSIVAQCPIRAGEVFSEDNLTTKRPGDGINPMRWPEVLGMRAKRDFEEDELIEL